MSRLPRKFTLGGISGFAVLGAEGSHLQSLKIEGIKDTIAVASGNGGVGKSTTAVNLAVSLTHKCQLKVGLLDADTMMKLHGKPEVSADKKMIPIENFGAKCMLMVSCGQRGGNCVERSYGKPCKCDL